VNRVYSIGLGVGIEGTELLHKTLGIEIKIWRLESSTRVGQPLTGFARIPPKLAVSYPKSMSPTRRPKQENRSMGVATDQEERELAIVLPADLRPGGRYKEAEILETTIVSSSRRLI
jgi:hypothetical protein